MILLYLLFAAFAAADLFLAAAVVWHLRSYTLEDWAAERILIPIYLIASGFLLALALVSLLRIREFPDITFRLPAAQIFPSPKR